MAVTPASYYLVPLWFESFLINCKSSSPRPQLLGKTATLRGEQLLSTVLDTVPCNNRNYMSLGKRAHWAKSPRFLSWQVWDCGSSSPTPSICSFLLSQEARTSRPSSQLQAIWLLRCHLKESPLPLGPVPVACYLLTPSQWRLLLSFHHLCDRAPCFVQFCLCLIFVSSVLVKWVWKCLCLKETLL